jgi:DNA repair photolyase
LKNIDLKSRGAGINPKNRFEEIYLDYDDKDIEHFENEKERIPTTYYFDNTKTILAKNDSPDLGFDYSINPYRGCEHGCIYCYARPTHEYLGFSAGLDFETKIMVKKDAPLLLEKEFKKKSWIPQPIMFSGNTDCYQPIERKFEITRKCIEVFKKFNHPVGLITKNALILRDIDLLAEMAKENLATAVISITTLKRDLSRKLEPRTSVPSERFNAVERLAEAGINVGVNVAPIIPGLNDEEIPAILKEASERGAKFAGHTIVRLPYSVKELFTDWLERNYPEKASKIINRIHEVRNGNLNDANWGTRLSGKGETAEATHKLFKMSCDKYGLNKEKMHMDYTKFRKSEIVQEEMF